MPEVTWEQVSTGSPAEAAKAWQELRDLYAAKAKERLDFQADVTNKLAQLHAINKLTDISPIIGPVSLDAANPCYAEAQALNAEIAKANDLLDSAASTQSVFRETLHKTQKYAKEYANSIIPYLNSRDRFVALNSMRENYRNTTRARAEEYNAILKNQQEEFDEAAKDFSEAGSSLRDSVVELKAKKDDAERVTSDANSLAKKIRDKKDDLENKCNKQAQAQAQAQANILEKYKLTYKCWLKDVKKGDIMPDGTTADYNWGYTWVCDSNASLVPIDLGKNPSDDEMPRTSSWPNVIFRATFRDEADKLRQIAASESQDKTSPAELAAYMRALSRGGTV